MITFLPQDNRLWVNTPHGAGLVFCVESVAHDNMIWTVILQKDGRILHYTSLQLRASIQHTAEINLEDVKAPFPSDVEEKEKRTFRLGDQIMLLGEKGHISNITEDAKVIMYTVSFDNVKRPSATCDV